MQGLKVHVRQKDLAAFRRRVLYHYRRKPKHEYMEVLFVRYGFGEYFVESFHKIRNLETSEYHVNYDDVQYQALKNEAAAQGLMHASIHTHTVSDESPSVCDQEGAHQDNDALIGICTVDDKGGRLSTKVAFWMPNLPLKLNEVID